MTEQTPLTSCLHGEERAVVAANHHMDWVCVKCGHRRPACGHDYAARHPAAEAGLREALEPLFALAPILDAAEQGVVGGSLPVDVMNITQPIRFAIKATRAALAAPAPDDAAHLVWLREGDRLARALWGLGYESFMSVLRDDVKEPTDDQRRAAAAIIAALAGEPQP